jgi:hypothetical protein
MFSIYRQRGVTQSMKLPEYAKSTPKSLLVNIDCRGACNTSRYAKVSKLPWNKHGPNNDPDMWAECLRCGYKAEDSYNWRQV